MTEFDKEKFKNIVKEKFITYESYVLYLNTQYNLDKKLNTIQKWGQIANPNVPTAKELPIVAESLNIEIIDLYTHADESRKRIAINEIQLKPSMYIPYFENHMNAFDVRSKSKIIEHIESALKLLKS